MRAEPPIYAGTGSGGISAVASRSGCLASFACKRTMAVAGPGSGVGMRGPLIDSARSILVTGCCVHDRGRSLIPSASRPATSAMRAARRSGRRVVASM